MSLTHRLTTIIRAAHCRSTHHFFAIDALNLIRSERGKRFASQLLKHHSEYLRGAKAPDKEFRDFRNHVVHVDDHHWGGAPAEAEEWYDRLQTEMAGQNWGRAAYCAGVLSHYFTDPIMPLHTAQSPRESVFHRPLEWSVTKSYDRIMAHFRASGQEVIFQTSSHNDWLSDAVCAGAELAHRNYDALMDHYDLKTGSKRPEEGFDSDAIEILSSLFGVAIYGWSHILERAVTESPNEIPEAPLTIAAVMATITMPVGWITRRIESRAEQKAVRALFDEYAATGTLVEHLPDEVRSVAEEREADRRESGSPGQAPSTLPLAPPQPNETTEKTSEAPRENFPSPSLAFTDDLVDAPSIGPKTAKRFEAIGITTVEQFLSGSPQTMADQLNTRWIKPETLWQWQQQAELVATVPGLCGYKSQLLVGVGCSDQATLASSEARDLHQSIDEFASTKEGKRVLRSAKVPSVDEVAMWVRNAKVQLRQTA